ncbi:hypothetical protein K458DRAFT_396974 [Lentithecium fluviatile CBS 122367]|uniref:Uncharacterized protein n=1 Tax=Lentithecium fluviatile CBS 122367 TaxID=1168545 RepID=A0A6G1IEK7_9PLEO|nr:hypothetical protein K458DRAFT_396974 [Lentithecium fluviatile CBS 122367]
MGSRRRHRVSKCNRSPFAESPKKLRLSSNLDEDVRAPTKRRQSLSLDERVTVAYEELCDFSNTNTINRLTNPFRSIQENISKINSIYRRFSHMRVYRGNLRAKPTPAEQEKPPKASSLRHSCSWNLAFAAKMCARLPRGIRDILYEEFWMEQAKRESTHVAIDGPSVMFDGALVPVPDTELFMAWHHDLNPAIMRPEFVGSQVAFEAVEALYRSEGMRWDIEIRRAWRLQEIERVLGDTFCRGLEAASVMRELYV